jgi:hypothetical protein
MSQKTTAATPCPGCGLVLPNTDGPTHAYIGASPACWARYGELLVREFGELRNPAIHRLSVDTYAVQHPGVPERRSIRSVAVHLMGLCLVLERGWAPQDATKRIGGLVARARPDWLDPPLPNGTLTVEHPLAAPPAEHEQRVREWGLDVWGAWQAHHPAVHAWLDSYL